MATREILHCPDQAADASIRVILEAVLEPPQVDNALRAGAKIRISITFPYPKPPRKAKRVIDEALARSLQAMGSDRVALEAEVATLSGPEIRKLASLLGLPISSGVKLASLRAQLAQSLMSDGVWRGISGEPPREPQSGPAMPGGF